MKSNRGSISIFMLLIVPILAISILALYNYLRTYKTDNLVLKNVRNISEVQLSNNNAHLFDNYGILSYLDQNIIENQVIALNDQVDVIDLDVDHFSLNDPVVFFDATKMASKNVIAIQTVTSISALLMPHLDDDFSYDLIQLKKTFEKKVERFFDFHKEVKKIESLITSNQYESVLKSIEYAIETKLNDVLSSYEVLLESEKGFGSSQIDHYKTSLDEAVRISEEWATRIADLRRLNLEITGVRQKVHELDSEMDQITSRIEVTSVTKDEWEGLVEELTSLETQKKDSLHRLSALEDNWNDTINKIIKDHKNIKPKLLDQIAELSSTIDEMLFDLEAVENMTLPSEGYNLSHSHVEGKMEMSLLDGFIYDEYWMGVLKSFDKDSARNFNPLGTKGDRESVINGEVEFLVIGKLSDPQNIQMIKLRLFSIRSVANMLHITSDATKTAQISRVTAPFPTPWNGVAYAALMTLWSSAEGYLDMIELFKGEGHHFIKQDEEWHLSLDNLLQGSISSIVKSNSDEKDYSPDGKLYYQDYLRIMLYAQAKEVTAKRAMFLLDANLQDVSHQQFNLKAFSIGHRIDLSYMKKGLDETQSTMSMVNEY